MLQELINARNYLAEHGYVKHGYLSDKGEVCLAGAHVYSNYNGAVNMTILFPFARALGFEGPAELFDWNDQPERTKEEVLARLDCAIEKNV